MYVTVPVPQADLDNQRPYIGDETVERLRRLAQPLKGVRVLNLTVSPFATRIVDLLSGVVPLLRDLGIEAHWQFVPGDVELSQSARLLYAGLSGQKVEWGPQSAGKWILYSRLNAHRFDGSYDIVVVHDPQPTALLPALIEAGRDMRDSRWIWHSHLDLRHAQEDVWASIESILPLYDARVLPHEGFAVPKLGTDGFDIIPPAIDPSSPRNRALPPSAVSSALVSQGIAPNRPLVLQVGPFSDSFNPVGAIQAVRQAQSERPDLQLLMVQPAVDPSPEGWSRFEEIARRAGENAFIRVVAVEGEAGSTLINAAQRAASVVLQTSVPAGFSVPLWEAMWKGKPVVAGVSGGLTHQIEAGVSGLLISDENAFADAILALLADPFTGQELGKAARERVRKHHLVTRFLEDELHLFGSLLSGPRHRGMAREVSHA